MLGEPVVASAARAAASFRFVREEVREGEREGDARLFWNTPLTVLHEGLRCWVLIQSVIDLQDVLIAQHGIN